MPKDMQRTKIERVEASTSVPILDAAYVQHLVDSTLSSRWWGTRRPDLRKLTVQFGWKACTSGINNTRICIASGPTYLTVFHALAHYLQPDESVPHGPEFARAYVQLVTRFIGEPQGNALRVAFRAEKVKLSTWSPEAKAAASERAVARQFKSAAERARQLVADLEGEDDA